MGNKVNQLIGKNMKKILLLLALVSIDAFARDKIKTTTDYWYQYDTDGYENHQISERLQYNTVEVFYQHNETTNPVPFYYDIALLSNTFTYTPSFSNTPIIAKLGVGTIYGEDWNAIPAYETDITYKNVNLNVSRNPVAAWDNNQTTGNSYSKNYTDDIVLSADFDITNKYTIVVGGMYSLYDDGNVRKGVMFKNIYNVTDEFSLQTHSRMLYTEETKNTYFSPDVNEYHRFLAVYAYPITNDLVLKASAGPSLVNIADRREIVPYYDVKIVYNNEHIGKWNIGYSCNETTYDYRFCQAGASVNFNF